LAHFKRKDNNTGDSVLDSDRNVSLGNDSSRQGGSEMNNAVLYSNAHAGGVMNGSNPNGSRENNYMNVEKPNLYINVDLNTGQRTNQSDRNDSNISKQEVSRGHQREAIRGVETNTNGLGNSAFTFDETHNGEMGNSDNTEVYYNEPPSRGTHVYEPFQHRTEQSVYTSLKPEDSSPQQQVGATAARGVYESLQRDDDQNQQHQYEVFKPTRQQHPAALSFQPKQSSSSSSSTPQPGKGGKKGKDKEGKRQRQQQQQPQQQRMQDRNYQNAITRYKKEGRGGGGSGGVYENV
jgi:hypothetical protein